MSKSFLTCILGWTGDCPDRDLESARLFTLSVTGLLSGSNKAELGGHDQVVVKIVGKLAVVGSDDPG